MRSSTEESRPSHCGVEQVAQPDGLNLGTQEDPRACHHRELHKRKERKLYPIAEETDQECLQLDKELTKKLSMSN